ncbi:MAG: polyprenyl synthetase family protein [Planctomycetota bacterium]
MDPDLQPNQITDEELIEQIDGALDGFIDHKMPSDLNDAVCYALFGGGKRIRPLLCLRACIAVGGEAEDAWPAAGSLELIHTFSLVHDDLPAMDDDDLRRGRPTLHKYTNEAMAILAGDAMTALAFEMLAVNIDDAETSKRCIAELSKATRDMIGGQVYDTFREFPESWGDMTRLKMTHSDKTGALLIASVQMGGICGGASEQQLKALWCYAHALGLMFQAVDDLLDVTQTTEKMGKATGKDADQGKLTYPGLLGVDATRQEIVKLRKEAIDALGDFDEKAEPLRKLAWRLANRES